MPLRFPLFAFTAFLVSVTVVYASEASRFTETVKEVSLLHGDSKQVGNVRPGDTVNNGDTIRTANSARAEVATKDGSVTRIGAESLVHFDTISRSIHLQQGSVLVDSVSNHKPTTVKTFAASASVAGGSLIVSTTPDGGSKVLMLAGYARVKVASGKSTTLQAGEMIFVTANKRASEIATFSLDEQVSGSLLVKGFSHALPGESLLKKEISLQNLLASDSAEFLHNGLAHSPGGENFDSNLLQRNPLMVGGRARPIPTRTLRVPPVRILPPIDERANVPPRQIPPVRWVPIRPIQPPPPTTYIPPGSSSGSTMVRIRESFSSLPVPGRIPLIDRGNSSFTFNNPR